MIFPIGTLIATVKFPLQICEVLGYTEDGEHFFVNIIQNGNGAKYVDKDLDVALEFEASEWFIITDLTKVLL